MGPATPGVSRARAAANPPDTSTSSLLVTHEAIAPTSSLADQQNKSSGNDQQSSRIPTTNEITGCRLGLTSFDLAPFCAAPIPNQKRSLSILYPRRHVALRPCAASPGTARALNRLCGRRPRAGEREPASAKGGFKVVATRRASPHPSNETLRVPGNPVEIHS